MQIGSIGSMGGLSATGAAIQAAQSRFEDRAEDVIAAAADLSAETPVGSEPLVNGLVGLEEERAVNGVLFGVFRRQQEQQQALIDLVGRA